VYQTEHPIAELLFGAHKSNDYESNKQDSIKIMKFANLVDHPVNIVTTKLGLSRAGFVRKILI
jgi:hypothetical protein